MPNYFTKSQFITALECPRKNYYGAFGDVYVNKKREDSYLQALAEGGYQIEELAKQYYDQGVEVLNQNENFAISETMELLKRDRAVIHGAALAYKHYFAKVDILIKAGKNIRILEVKSKSYNGEKQPDEEFLTKKGYLKSDWKPYLYDVAYQQWVTEKLFPGFNITPYLIMPDKTKRATVDGLNQLFKMNSNEWIKANDNQKISKDELGDSILAEVDVSKYVQMIFDCKDIEEKNKTEGELKTFEERLAEYSYYAINKISCPIKIGRKCKNCEYRTNDNKEGERNGFKECWNSFCGNSDNELADVLELWNYSKLDKLIENGIYSLKDIPKAYFFKDDGTPLGKSSQRQYMQVQKAKDNSGEFIDDALNEVMEGFKYPLHFIDFETMQSALPFTKGRGPYEQTAFQFSCHTLHEDGKVDHHEFISTKPGHFPNFDFVTELKNTLDKDHGTIFRYSTHENTVLRQIRGQLIDYVDSCRDSDKTSLEELVEWVDTVTQWSIGRNKKSYGSRNMVDMLELVKGYYYHPAMKGSNSIKDVLPAVLLESVYLREKYSKPLEFGTHLKGQTFWVPSSSPGMPVSPYKLLPPVLQNIDSGSDGKVYDVDGAVINDGTAAMLAYAKVQFSDTSIQERKSITSSLLKYCELDTLAMLMIYEHWSLIL